MECGRRPACILGNFKNLAVFSLVFNCSFRCRVNGFCGNNIGIAGYNPRTAEFCVCIVEVETYIDICFIRKSYERNIVYNVVVVLTVYGNKEECKYAVRKICVGSYALSAVACNSAKINNSFDMLPLTYRKCGINII